MSPAALANASTDLPPHLVLPHIPLTFDNTDPDRSALQLVHTLCPAWKTEAGPVEFVRFTDGITNVLIKAVKRRPGQTPSQVDRDAILLRAYGQGTDVLIDRDRELQAHGLLANLGLAPPLLAKFDNGLLYRYVEGEVCTPEDLRRPEIYRQVAKRLGQWHGSLPVSALTPKSQANGTAEQGNGEVEVKRKCKARPYPNTWVVMERWIEALPADTEEQKNRRNVLSKELAEVAAKFGDTPGLNGKDYVFGHCDLLSGNVIVAPPSENETTTANGNTATPTERPVDFIDYEYATPSPAAFDIANHFAEWVGFECDYGAVPTRSQRREFLQHYVKSFHAHANKSDAAAPSISQPDLDKDVAQLYHQVDAFRGIPGLYWGIWSLIQATISQIDFDYASYADLRLGEYWAWKAETDGSRAREGKELPLRERRWAEE